MILLSVSWPRVCVLAIVMDLYSRKIIGWAMDKRMTTPLVARAMQMAIHLRRPAKGLIFHSDRGSQYTSQPFQPQKRMVVEGVSLDPSRHEAGRGALHSVLQSAAAAFR